MFRWGGWRGGSTPILAEGEVQNQRANRRAREAGADRPGRRSGLRQGEPRRPHREAWRRPSNMPTLQMARARRRVGLLVRNVRASGRKSSARERRVAGGAAYAIWWGMGVGLTGPPSSLLQTTLHRYKSFIGNTDVEPQIL